MKLGLQIDGRERKWQAYCPTTILLPCIFIELFPLNHFFYHDGCCSWPYIHKSTKGLKFTLIHTQMLICMYTHTHIHIHIYVYTHIHTYIYIYMYTHTHTHIHIYVYTHIHTYIYICRHYYLCLVNGHFFEYMFCTFLKKLIHI